VQIVRKSRPSLFFSEGQGPTALKRWLVEINMKCLPTAGDRICQDHLILMISLKLKKDITSILYDIDVDLDPDPVT